MRRQIRHMIKYHYLPWDAGKMKYGKYIFDFLLKKYIELTKEVKTKKNETKFNKS